MTTIKFCEEENNRQIIVSGHAGYSVKGKDIVCAGISALVLSFGYFLEDLCDKGLTKYQLKMNDDGYFNVICEVSGLEALTAYQITRQGLESIAESYPEYVKVETGKNIF